MVEKERLSFLKTSEWIWLVVVIASASVANVAGLHTISTSLRDDMLELDRRWQERSASVQRDLKGDIKELKQSLPPEWFRSMVETNSRHIESHEKRLDAIEKLAHALEKLAHPKQDITQRDALETK